VADLVAVDPEYDVRFGVLGPLRVVDGAGAQRVISAAKQRIVLAALLLAGGGTVPAASLAEALWDASLPPNAPAVLRTYVMRLRRALGPAGVRIVGQPSGWAVELHRPSELDLTEVDWLWRAARAAREAGEWHQASSLLVRALSLWRGEPLADVASPALARRESGWLGELRIQLAEARADADLRLGRHGEVVAELRRLVADHPLREHLRVQLMLACYLSGHQAAALEVYRDARTTLAEELGVEPGHELRQMHQKILTGDPDLTEPALAVVTARAPASDDRQRAGPEAAAPRQLPASVPQFTGRAAELRRLSELAGEAVGEVTAPISVISGMAGVGKTALAVRWAHQVAECYPGGQLYVDLRGYGPSAEAAEPAEVMRGFLGALGVVKERVPVGLDAQAGLYRSLLAGQRMLIVLDNARDEAQVRPLLPGSAACPVIVTSRRQLAGLAATVGARILTLDVLPEADAAAMLAARLGQLRVAAEPAAAAEITGLCGHLPLALAIATARAAARPAHPLAALASELREVGDRLDALDTGESAASVRAAFSWSCRHLGAAAARTFRLLGIHPGPDISAAAAASLAGLSPRQASSTLRELTAASLLEESSPGRYTLHGLLRCYAAELAGTVDGDDDRREAVRRTLDHYLHTANSLLSNSWRVLELAAPGRGVRPEPVAPHCDQAWFEAEHKILLRLTSQAAADGFDAHAWQLAWIMTDFLGRRGYWHDLAAAQHTALAAVRRADDRAGEARVYHGLGHTLVHLGRFEDGRAHLRRALELYVLAADREGQAHVCICCSYIVGRQHRYREALASARQALDLLGPVGGPDLRALTLNNIGYCYALADDYRQALIWCEQARDLCHDIGARLGEADAWDSIACAHQRLGRHSRAINCYRRAQRLRSDNRYECGRTLVRLGDAYLATGNTVAAREAWQQALEILDDLHHADAVRVRAKLYASA
jgi:DNA-binding SARP family transcriptional activator/tetratricopeptide (TPR) repeat protein